jgi:hypothetical protein
MDYAKLSLSEVRTGIAELIRDVEATFGSLDPRQLNWRPDSARWSVAQCFEHLLKMNALMLQAAEDALDDGKPKSVWQRLPLLPSAFGPLMVRSQSPDAARKYTAPAPGRPSTSEIPPDIVRRFIEQQRGTIARLGAMDEERAARIIMASPFIKVICYSVLDGWRLGFAHGRRHVEQARRVIGEPGFPATNQGPAARI